MRNPFDGKHYLGIKFDGENLKVGFKKKKLGVFGGTFRSFFLGVF